MANKTMIIFMSILLSVALMAGCDSDKQKRNADNLKNTSIEITNEITKETPLTFPKVYEEDVDDTLSFHADIVPPIGLKAENAEIEVTYMVVDFNTALEELFSDVDNIQKEEIILQPENSLHQSAYGGQDEIMSNNIGMFRMEKTHWAKVKNAIELSRKDLAYNAELYTKPQQFAFGTAEENWEALCKTLQKLGVETELKPTIFYMNYKTLEQEDEKNKNRDDVRSEEKDKIWSEEDNGYYISAVQCIDGNTVFANTYYGNGIEGEADTANVLAYIDKSGIQMLELTRIFGQITKTDKSWKMLPFEDIVNAVKKRFGLTITGDKVSIREFRFSFMTEAVNDEVYRLLPVWYCNYEQTGRDGVDTMKQLIIHAATGEEVIYELY